MGSLHPAFRPASTRAPPRTPSTRSLRTRPGARGDARPSAGSARQRGSSRASQCLATPDIRLCAATGPGQRDELPPAMRAEGRLDAAGPQTPACAQHLHSRPAPPDRRADAEASGRAALCRSSSPAGGRSTSPRTTASTRPLVSMDAELKAGPRRSQVRGSARSPRAPGSSCWRDAGRRADLGCTSSRWWGGAQCRRDHNGW